MKRKNERFKAILAIVLWAIFVLLLVVFAQIDTHRSSKAQLYDSQCLSEPISNPLKDCRK